MTVLQGVAAGVVLVALGAASAQATEGINGRWAADPSSCSGSGAAPSPLVVTDYAVRWTAGTCRIARMYKTGDTVHIQALCEGGGRSIPVSLRPHAGRLVVTWDRGARGELRRCP
jgi:hypothetical protein